MVRTLKAPLASSPAVLLLAAILAAGPLPGAEKPESGRFEAALDEAKKWAAARKWREAVTAGEKLRQASRDLRGEAHPDTALAEMFLGEARRQLGEPSLAETHFRRALSLQEQVLPRDHPELVTTLTQLGAVICEQGRHDEAAGLLRRALDQQARQTGENEATALAAINLARVLKLQRDFAGAAKLLERAAGIYRQTAGGTADETLLLLTELAAAHEAAGDFAAADLATAERVAGLEAVTRPDAPELCDALLGWAGLAEARAHWPAMEKRALRAQHSAATLDAARQTRAAALLGWAVLQQGRVEEAQPLLEQALARRRAQPDPDPREVAESHQQLGWLRFERGDFVAAGWEFEQAFALREKALSPHDPATLESLASLGEALGRAGALAPSAEIFERLRYRTEEATGRASADTAAATRALALAYEDAGRWTEAIDAAQRGLRLAEERLGPAAPETLEELFLLSRVCEKAGVLEPALRQYARLAEWFARHRDVAPRRRAQLQRSYAIAALRAGAPGAEALFRESHRLHRAIFGAPHPETLRALGDLWTCFDQTRQPARAVEVAHELAAETKAALGDAAPAVAEIWERLGRLQITLGDRTAALRAFRQALEVRAKAGPAEAIALLGRAAAAFEGVRDFARAAELRMERLQALRRQTPGGSAEEAAACGELGLDYFRLRDFVPARGMFAHQRQLAVQQGGAASVTAVAATARLGDVAVAMEDWPTALQERQELVAGCAKSYGTAHPEHGRALLLLGETQMASGHDEAAEQSLADAADLLRAAQPTDPLLARVAADRAVVALRRSRADDAKRLTRDAVTGTMRPDEAMAEALTRLGDAWQSAGDRATAETALTGALAILSQVAGDFDEQTLTLLERVGRLRLQVGRAGAAELLHRAVAATETVTGRDAPALGDRLGWLALAQLAEGGEAVEIAQRRVELLKKLGRPEPDAELLLALAEMRAGRRGLDEVAVTVRARWAWLALFPGV